MRRRVLDGLTKLANHIIYRVANPGLATRERCGEWAGEALGCSPSEGLSREKDSERHRWGGRRAGQGDSGEKKG